MAEGRFSHNALLPPHQYKAAAERSTKPKIRMSRWENFIMAATLSAHQRFGGSSEEKEKQELIWNINSLILIIHMDFVHLFAIPVMVCELIKQHHAIT